MKCSACTKKISPSAAHKVTGLAHFHLHCFHAYWRGRRHAEILAGGGTVKLTFDDDESKVAWTYPPAFKRYGRISAKRYNAKRKAERAAKKAAAVAVESCVRCGAELDANFPCAGCAP